MTGTLPQNDYRNSFFHNLFIPHLYAALFRKWFYFFTRLCGFLIWVLSIYLFLVACPKRLFYLLFTTGSN